MTALHAYFHQRNQQAFQRLLDPARSQQGGGGPSTSGGRSWSRPSPLSSAPCVDVNARDFLGRTVLHLAASSTDASAPEFVRLLLANPTINVNIADAESHWTPLHRALYHGNLPTALLLLQRTDIDISARDIEGYTPFDLYNSTIEGTVPDHDWPRAAELYTWGSNRNAALGVGDGDDRAHPELVSLRFGLESEKDCVDVRFTPIRVREVAMSRLHTVIVTDEPRGNLRVCGFGNGGRLGPGQHTQYSPIPIPGFNHTVAAVAVGQDHTLVLTKTGEVYSWGLNRFSQLGYVVEAASGVRVEEPIQLTPRKIAGAIKNRLVLGVAACKTASACWTSDEVFTWGTNNGQLGYDRSAQPVQISPRVVTKINKPVISVSITDSALACLLETQEVVCLWNDGHYKVKHVSASVQVFPAYSFPSEFVAYRPPQSANRNSASIDKVTSCEDTFAALSSSGELFVFSLFSPPESASGASKARFNVQPQRVWALRKQFSAVRDVALGVDGSILICTESGHVFLRSRNLKAGQGSSTKAFKFQRVPYIQRVTKVCANATGAFAALRTDWLPHEVKMVGNRLPQDLAMVQPYTRVKLTIADESASGFSTSLAGAALSPTSEHAAEFDEEEEDHAVQNDILQLKNLCSVIFHLKDARRGADGARVLNQDNMPYDADLIIHVQSTGIELPAHRVILAARSAVLCQVLSEGKTVRDTRSSVTIQGHITKTAAQKLARVTFTGCNPLSVLIVLTYLYSDEPLAVWDHRIGHAIKKHLVQLKVTPAQVKNEVQALASLLELSSLADVLDVPVKRAPKLTLMTDMQRLFTSNQSSVSGPRARAPLAPDVVLQLADREVSCHSVLLRSRSPFFAAFFDDRDWTRKRWTAEGKLFVDLKHMKWRAMEPVLKYLCWGADKDIFDVVEDVRSAEELIDFMFEVMAVANELHVDRLMLVCSWVIMKRVWINNVCSVLTDATHYHAMALVRLLQEYMAINMELFLESRMLEDLAPDLIKQLSAYVRSEQAKKYPVSRSTKIVDKAMETWGEWLALQDIPLPIVPSASTRAGALKDSARLSPPGPSKRANKLSNASAPDSPLLRPTFSARPVATGIPDDEMFMMDEPEPAGVSTPTPAAPGSISRAPSGSESPARPAVGWRTITSAPKVDMKSIMAEASTSTPAKPTLGKQPIAAPVRSLEAQPSRGTPPRVVPELAATGKAPGAIPRMASGGGPSWRTGQLPAQPASPLPPSGPGKDGRAAGSAPSGVAAGAHPAPGTSPVSSGALHSAPRSQPGTPRKPVAPGLGPVFTPTKQAPASSSASAASSIRRVSSGNVWTPPPVQPIVQPSAPPPGFSSSGSSAGPSQGQGPSMSFAAIQLAQAQAQEDVSPGKKDRRSLVQIQEEERARQVEEDFLRWRGGGEVGGGGRGDSGPGPKGARRERKPPKGGRGGAKGGSERLVGAGDAPAAGAPRPSREKAQAQEQTAGTGAAHTQGPQQSQGQGQGVVDPWTFRIVVPQSRIVTV
ncbi:hypothetical protein C8Q80DRAFT_1347035 [Daedaleopsis nitida]|nr:hypothetical protein C8Q80DRAFT_1347035 [Daedaleopsis nitida]